MSSKSFAQSGGEDHIAVAWSSDTTIKAAVTGKRLKVVGGLVHAGAAGGTVKFQSVPAVGDAVDLTGAITVGANGVLFDHIEEGGFFEPTVKGSGLKAVVAAGAFNGSICVQTV